MSGQKHDGSKRWKESRKGFRHQMILAACSTGISYREGKHLVEILLDEAKKGLARDGELCLDGFALLHVRPQSPKREWRFGQVVKVNQTPGYDVSLLP